MSRPSDVARSAARYAAAATNWPVAIFAVLGTAVSLVVVSVRPAGLWPLHGMALGLITGASALAADERCSAVVDVTPRPMWWRTALHACVPAVLAATWLSAHLFLRARLPEHLGVLIMQGVAVALAGFAASTSMRRADRGEPGVAIAAVAAPLVIASALARPFEDAVPLFPIWPDEQWQRSAVIWAIVTMAATALLVASLHRDARAHRAAIGFGGRSLPRSS